MFTQCIQSGIAKVLVTVIVVLQLAACGGGGGGSSDGGSGNDTVVADVDNSSNAAAGSGEVTAATAKDVKTKDVKIKGSIGDGPVIGANVTVYSNNGQQIGTVVSDNTASFKSTFKVKGNEYPLLLEVSGGFDLVTGREPDFQMLSVMLKPSDKQVNINPFTCLIVKIAQLLPGGINAGNIDTARTYVSERLGFGLDSNAISDPITTRITDSNAANIIKASEAMGEMVRRSRDLITASGTQVSGDKIMTAIAADMVDGFLNGSGAKGTNSKISAVVNVVAGQVLVEALGNKLKVGGVVATNTIDQAIATTRPGIKSSQMTDSVRITAAMLEQTRVALVAAQIVDSSARVADIANTVNTIAANSLPADIEAVLPADASASLDYAVTQSATASTTEMLAINQVASNGGDSGGTVSSGSSTTDPVNTAPVTQAGSFSLSWTAPVSRADGTPLSLADIAGFRIYYGDTAGNYPDSVNIADGTAQAATVTEVPSGTYHIVMTTYDVDGRESGYSTEISKTVQ